MLIRNTSIWCLMALCGVLLGVQGAHADNLRCLACHSAPSFRKTTGGVHAPLYVDADQLAASVHSSKDCTDCHADLRNQRFPHKRQADPVQCVRCHHNGNVVGSPVSYHLDKYADSVHGRAARRNDPDAPRCKDCHGSHAIRPAEDARSSVSRFNVPSTCGRCHFDPLFAKRRHLYGVAEYRNSIHAKVLGQHGPETAAVCTDCHGVHDIESPSDLGSRTSRLQVPKTCGRCHKKIYEGYRKSIHGRAVAKGVKDAPVCTNCHGEHGIVKPTAPSSSVYPIHVAATCSKCHGNVRIQRKYGLPADRMMSYLESYHGVAGKYGEVSVANCATCHGAHDIRPSSDPESAVNKKNLPKTCGACHPAAGKNFAKGSIHLFPSKHKDVATYWVRMAYMLFVIVLIGSFCVCILLDLLARQRKRPRRPGTGDH